MANGNGNGRKHGNGVKKGNGRRPAATTVQLDEGLHVPRLFTTPDLHPYDEIEWERRKASIVSYTGKVSFEQDDVEFPSSWSINATNIVAEKYFRGKQNTVNREWSVKQIIDRVVDSIAEWGTEQGRFASLDDRESFTAELKHILVTQKASFNSPVWFNIGVAGQPQQASACFILHVEDAMSSIADWYRDEMFIFKGGSGSGLNVSNLRSSYEYLSIGGLSSGPVSFMRGADAAAGTIKSGGATRRAAKMVVFDVSHPDLLELKDGSPGFVWCKAVEERKARALKAAGFDMAVDSGIDAYSIQYQNANNSVRVTDEYMQAYLEGRDWNLRAVTTGDVVKTYESRDVMKQIAQAAWECADPGMQYHSTVNDWHTAPAAGPITASNPCFTGDTLVHTDKGLIRFDEIIDRVNRGESFGVYTHDATNPDEPAERVELTTPEAYMVTGTNEVWRLELKNGMEVKCTPNHRLWTLNRGWVEAQDLRDDDQVKVLTDPTPTIASDLRLPVSTNKKDYVGKGDWQKLDFELPEKWDEELAHYMGWLIGDGCISGNVITTVYAGGEKAEVLDRHMRLVTRLNGGRSPKPARLKNGTLQLRLSRRPLTRFFQALGVKDGRAHQKVVPWSILEAPWPIVGSFLRGLFDADGCVVDGEKTRYIGFASVSKELSIGVQRLLATLGIESKRYTTAKRPQAFEYTRKDGSVVRYESKPLHDLRIMGDSVYSFLRNIGFGISKKQSLLVEIVSGHEFYESKGWAHPRTKEFIGFETTYNLTEPRNHSYIVNGLIVSNCSEYMHIDNSPCNLASINLLKFLRGDSTFDTEAFEHAVAIVLLGQAILCVAADYPTEKIGENARGFRQLGIGYANLGALLMALGVPYDSDEGRAWAAAITSLMQAAAYRASARFAEVVGPYPGTDELPGFAHPENRGATLRVLRKHAAYSRAIARRPLAEDRQLDKRVELFHNEVVGAALPTMNDEELTRVAAEANRVWDETVDLAERFGVENSQVSVLAPTGTIGFMMDCDTTGVEPDLALKKVKKMVGGGTMSIVNQTLPRALRRLGYEEEQVEAIVAFVDENNTVVGAPALKPEHYDVFACSFTTDNLIGHMGHLKMMAAVQPFLSGAISKCVTGETLVATGDGLVRISSLHDGEEADSFRPATYEVASLDGLHKTDAFYYGGVRPVMEVTLRSGHRITGTPNHQLLVADGGKLEWRRLDAMRRGEYVALHYGADLWSALPPLFFDFEPSRPINSQKKVRIPREMTAGLAFLVGAYVAEGHTTKSNWTITITNSVDAVLDKVAEAWRSVFGVEPRVTRDPGKCPAVVVSSKTIVEFLQYLGCGARASGKLIPDAVLRSPRDMVLAFLQGLFLDAYATASGSKVAICVDSPRLLDTLQAILTNLGVVHGRITKWNPDAGKEYDEVYACGEHAKRLLGFVPFLEPDKAARARSILETDYRQSTADIVPGLRPRDLFELIPAGKSGRNGSGTGRSKFAFLCDARTKHVSRTTLERVAAHPGVVLPEWLQTILSDGLHFSSVESVEGAGEREVFDLSVPIKHAFVGNGIVNHNTVNVPEQATVEDMEEIFVEGWRLGLKAVAMYRDNCKADQPLSADQKKSVDDAVGETPPQAPRKRLPRIRNSVTYSFRVADTEGYVHVGLYPDTGQPGEMFIKVAKQGSTLAGVMGAFALSVSMGLQHGVPLETFVSKFMNDTFEPHGITDDPDIRFAKSLMDYIFRRLALDFLPEETRLALGIRSVQERTEALDQAENGNGVNLIQKTPEVNSTADLVPALDAPLCSNCGTRMRPAGSCFACESCGATSGCS